MHESEPIIEPAISISQTMNTSCITLNQIEFSTCNFAQQIESTNPILIITGLSIPLLLTYVIQRLRKRTTVTNQIVVRDANEFETDEDMIDYLNKKHL